MPKRSLHSKNNGRSKAVKKIDRETFDPKLDLNKVEQLSVAIDAMLSGERNKVLKTAATVKPLVQIAASLHGLPREIFKARLKAELLEGTKNEGRKPMAPVAEAPARIHPVATPRLTFKNAAKAIDFYKEALGARETFRFEVGGSIPHAEIVIGDSTILLTEEWPEGNRFSAETLGNSPVLLTLSVDDVDFFAARALAAGMKVKIPIRNQFYGRREGTFADPFGYLWSISTVIEEMSVEEMHRRMKGATGPESGPPLPESTSAAAQVRAGFPTITPYLVAQNADSLIDFIKKTFAAEELSRDVGSAGGYHCELRVEDSTLMIGGGAPGLRWKGESVLGSFHIYVRDCDAVYQSALNNGAKSLHEPADQPWGERTAHVVDAEGNRWYIATFKGKDHRSEGAPAIQPFLHPLRAEPVIKFLKAAFAAEELGRYTSPDGVIHHTTLNIGTSHLEMGEAEGPYQPMKSMFYLYVPDSDALYRSAIAAGATSIHEPQDQPYGDRVGAITDAFGNQWWLGTPIRK